MDGTATRNDINSRLFSHLLGSETKLVLEAYINHTEKDSNAVVPRVRVRSPVVTLKQQNRSPEVYQYIQTAGNVLYVKARREKLQFFYWLFVKTAETFVKIRSVLRKSCRSLINPKDRRLWKRFSPFRDGTRRRHRRYEDRDALAYANSERRRIWNFLDSDDDTITVHDTESYEESFEESYKESCKESYKESYEKSSEDRKQRKLIIDISSLDGPDQLDQAAWIHFRIDTTENLVRHLKSRPYVHLREGFFAMSAEVLRSVRKKGLPDDMLIKLATCDEVMDTADTILGVLCNDILRHEKDTTHVRCFMAGKGSDLRAIECKTLKPNDDEHLECRCEGSKLQKVASGKDFSAWERQSTASVCSQCKFRLVPKGYDEIHKHMNEILSTVSPSIHEKDMSECDFLLEDQDGEDDQTDTDDDHMSMSTRQAVLSSISEVSDVLTLSVIRANMSILLILLLLFLPIIIIFITSARKDAEIIAAGVAYIPTMLATLAALVTIAPAKMSTKLGKRLLYRKVQTFKEMISLLNLQNYSNRQWREALMNMDHGTFNMHPFGNVYNRSEDVDGLSLSDWCQMTLEELQNYNSPTRVISNKQKRVLLVKLSYGRSIRPIVPRGEFLFVEPEWRLSNAKVEDLAHCDEHRNLIFKENVN